jgi:hypothetical protein
VSPCWAPWWVGSTGAEFLNPAIMENSKKPPERTKTVSSESDDEPCSVESFPRFMVIQSKDKDKQLATLSPFIVEKTILGLVGKPKSVKKLRSGDLLVECERKAQIENILKSKTFHDIPVT